MPGSTNATSAARHQRVHSRGFNPWKPWRETDEGNRWRDQHALWYTRQRSIARRFSPAKHSGADAPPARTQVMLNLWGSSSLDRRELLRVGGLAVGGLALPAL